MDQFMAQRGQGGGFGVVGLTADWCSPADLDEATAEKLAAELNARGVGIDAVRWVGRTPVQRAIWESAGAVDVWIRHRFQHGDEQWLGRVADEDGRVEWVRASDLRPDASQSAGA